MLEITVPMALSGRLDSNFSIVLLENQLHL